MSAVQDWLDATSDEEALTKLCHIHKEDYPIIVQMLKDGDLMGAIQFLRFAAKDRVAALDGATYFVRLIKRFEGL